MPWSSLGVPDGWDFSVLTDASLGKCLLQISAEIAKRKAIQDAEEEEDKAAEHAANRAYQVQVKAAEAKEKERCIPNIWPANYKFE